MLVYIYFNYFSALVSIRQLLGYVSTLANSLGASFGFFTIFFKVTSIVYTSIKASKESSLIIYIYKRSEISSCLIFHWSFSSFLLMQCCGRIIHISIKWLNISVAILSFQCSINVWLIAFYCCSFQIWMHLSKDGLLFNCPLFCVYKWP